MTQPLVLLASARPAGDTAAFVRQVFPAAARVLLHELVGSSRPACNFSS